MSPKSGFLSVSQCTSRYFLSCLYFHLGDKGRKGDRNEKLLLLRNLLDPTKSLSFRTIFDSFVRNVIAPHVGNIMKEEVSIYYQGFPCLRIVRPGEFSIGCHADISYGFSQGNVNFYVPLTRIFGTNSLVLESVPELEDWHVIDAQFGYIKRFYGVLCSHFTTSNNTDQTRVSLDFRVIPGSCWQAEHDHFTSVTGYYSQCIKPTSCINMFSHSTTEWIRVGELLQPDYRVGFPFTRK